MPRKRTPDSRAVMTVELVGPASEIAAAISSSNLVMKSCAPNCVIRNVLLDGIVSPPPAKPRAPRAKDPVVVAGPSNAG